MNIKLSFFQDKLKYAICRAVLSALIALMLCPSAAEAHAVPTEKVIEGLMDEGRADSRQGKYLDAIKQFLKVKQLADDNNVVNYQCVARYNIGVCYFFMSAHGEALHNFYESYKICKENDLGWQRESKIVNGIAGVYFEQEDFRRAYDFILPIYHTAKRLKDSASLCTFATDLALICNKLGHFNLSSQYIGEAMALSDKNTPAYAHCMAIEAEALYMQKRYDKTEEVAQKVISMNNADDSDHGISLIYLINIYTQRNDFKQALQCVKKAREKATLRNMPFLFESLSSLYRKMGDMQKAINCKDSVIAYNDSITDVANKQLLESSRTKLEVLRYTSDMNHEIAKMRQRHYVVLMLLCISLLLVVIAFIVVRNQKTKSRHQSQLLDLQIEKQQRDKEMAEERMKTVELEAHYRHEMMKQSLEQKQRELSATTMFVSSRNELIADLLNYLDSDSEMKAVPAVKTIMQHLNHLLKENDEHDNFLVNFEAANPGFMQRLQTLHPDLLPSDLRFLAYVRMNMQTKEIASLLNINPESCRRRKIRLSKKLGLESSSELYNYIIGMQ